jgi:hypothetical protein
LDIRWRMKSADTDVAVEMRASLTLLGTENDITVCYPGAT